MGLTERHWFENEDVPENYERALEDAVYNSRTNKKYDDDIVRCKDCKYCEYPNSEKEWCKKGHLHGKAETWFCADGVKEQS